MIEMINPYVVKILVTAREGDSIRSISKRIDLSYAWTYNWVNKLVDLGVMERKGQTVGINEKEGVYKEYMGFIKKMLGSKLSLTSAYSLPNWTGLEYAFTFTDAIFVWTKGGYNIGRSRDSYPLFIEILRKDLRGWEKFFSRFSVKYTKRVEEKKGIYFIMIPKERIEKMYVDGVSVISLKKTVEYAKKYVCNFEPALEMLNKMYGLNIKSKYAEKEFM